MTAVGLDIRHFGTENLAEIRQTIIDLHAAAVGPDRDDDFKKKFPWFVDHWGGKEGYACVIAYDGEEPVGFAYGAPSDEGREWWREYVEEVPTKHRTFAFSELAVHPSKRKQGVSDTVTRALFENRPEDLAVLLVDVTHPRVQSLYEQWGFKKIGERQPFPDSPVYAVMLAELPLK